MPAARYAQSWSLLNAMRDAVLKEIEGLREQKIVAHPLEVAVALHVSPEVEGAQQLQAFFTALRAKGQEPEAFLKELFVVSRVALEEKRVGTESSVLPGLSVHVEHAPGVKCPRCWHWDETDDADGLCRRCQNILGR